MHTGVGRRDAWRLRDRVPCARASLCSASMQPRRRGALAAVAALVLIGALSSCSVDGGAPPKEPRAAAKLRAELLQMMRDDQQERTGEGLPPGTKLPPAQDYTRTARLKEIIDDVGWPTHTMVGEDGGTAAWLIVQHADFDVEFQERALALLDAAVLEYEADATEAAYLADRVAVNRGRPQRFGSQVRCSAGEPRPATPLERPADVEDLRAEAGMEPLADYYDELRMMCAQEAADGQEAGSAASP